MVAIALWREDQIAGVAFEVAPSPVNRQRVARRGLAVHHAADCFPANGISSPGIARSALMRIRKNGNALKRRNERRRVKALNAS